MAEQGLQPFHRHVAELRQRIMLVVIFLISGASIGWGFREQLINWLRLPLHQNLYYTSPSGGLQFTLQVCLLVGIVMALPIAVYELIRFVQPAIEKYVQSKHFGTWQTIRLIAASYVLALLGVVFSYYIVLPAAFHFFASFNSSGVQSLITADKYFSFVINCMVVFAIIFQLPLILLFINGIRPIPPKTLRKYRKYVFIGSFVIALILPFSYDPITQTLMALPIIILYEISIIMIATVNRGRKIPNSTAENIRPTEVRKYATD